MSEPLNGQVVVRKGTTISLECKANGNPAPTVSWIKMGGHQRKHKKIPARELANNGMSLTLGNVNRRDAGKYQCTGTNGVGNDAIAYINVQVLCKYEMKRKELASRYVTH